ncbi:hypothetical protein [Parendozoicomonas sp. Alg238-R29]|uniref:hypothetical protein n=1 Tax=Parendozoicomonas sp. Alg238-R29 TaxID=2993446 RepID=UPI00248D5148|nr:hypothetical protein [Parendozoicomonas sp. Alg238-R29]
MMTKTETYSRQKPTGSALGEDHRRVPRSRSRNRKRKSKTRRFHSPESRMKRSNASGYQSYSNSSGYDSIGYSSDEAHIHERKTSRRRGHSKPVYHQNGRPYELVKPQLESGRSTKKGMHAANKWFSNARFENHKTAVSKVDYPEAHIENGRDTSLTPAPESKGRWSNVMKTWGEAKILGYYVASVSIYAGATAVLASCALATFGSILPFAIPSLAIATIIGGGMLAGGFIGLGAAKNGESLLPARWHWSDILSMTNYWRRLQLPTSVAMGV